MQTLDFDFIVVGAGSSGCVVANRLSGNPAFSVCLLEAGPSDLSPLAAFKTRIPIGNVLTLPDQRYNWGYAFKGHDGLRNRAIPSHRGRLTGGSSSVNGMIYIRGHARDYDEWKEQGNPGWGWSDVLPVFKHQERRELGATPLHGDKGELNVAPLRSLNPVTKAFLRAAEETQHPANADFNGPAQDGFGPWEVTQKNGQRWSSARAFLHPAMSRKNLVVLNGAETLKLTFERRRATGVSIRHHGVRMALTARREIILSAGAYNTPKLLLLSGIGPADDLVRATIKPVHDLPGVGKNLQDHPTAWIVVEDRSRLSAALTLATLPRYALASLQYVFLRNGALTSNAVEAGGFLRTHPGNDRPDIQYVFKPAIHEAGRFLPRAHGFTLMPILLRPRSRGRLELASPRVEDKPILHPHFLDDRADVDALIRGVRLGRQILEAPALARFRGRELSPGPSRRSDAEIEDFLRSTVATSFHPVGTCKMAPASDPESVVDARLNVRGVERLRVADASIMPTIIGGNTNAAAMMIGERGAAFAMEDAANKR